MRAAGQKIYAAHPEYKRPKQLSALLASCNIITVKGNGNKATATMASKDQLRQQAIKWMQAAVAGNKKWRARARALASKELQEFPPEALIRALEAFGKPFESAPCTLERNRIPVLWVMALRAGLEATSSSIISADTSPPFTLKAVCESSSKVASSAVRLAIRRTCTTQATCCAKRD